MTKRPFGTRTFETWTEAALNGYHTYDRNEEGTLMRKRTSNGWLYAFVPKVQIEVEKAE
jgi:hypothetical protein